MQHDQNRGVEIWGHLLDQLGQSIDASCGSADDDRSHT
jgi:hypothetical protein